MPTERLSMRKKKEILRLRCKHDRSFREIAKASGVGVGMANEVVSSATHIGLTWNEVELIAEEELAARMSQHYSTTILPARPLSSRDKAKVEGGVLIAQRWILSRLRNITCFSLDEINEHIAALLADLNSRVMKRYGKSRRQLFDELDRPAITTLLSRCSASRT